jgi:ankyrin repeat protein
MGTAPAHTGVTMPTEAPNNAAWPERSAADQQLLEAVLAPRRPQALRRIIEACVAGADPNGRIPRGCDAGRSVCVGSTLLTQAIQDAASRAVETLLEQGADASLADDNGWTPWMASTLADASKRGRIQALLADHGASRAGEHIGELARAIMDGDPARAAANLGSRNDLRILAAFRVDLLRHQILNANAEMLEWLLAQGMPRDGTHLISAVRGEHLDAVDRLLRHGLAAEQPGDEETALMLAAGMGALAIVQRLVEAGADVNRFAHGNSEWTAAFRARAAGHTDVADWLTRRMDPLLLERQRRIIAARNPKFQALYEQATTGADGSTDALVLILEQWDQRYGVEICAASARTLALKLATVPKEMDAFLAELVDLCPDAAESRAALRRAVQQGRVLDLWWD